MSFRMQRMKKLNDYKLKRMRDNYKPENNYEKKVVPIESIEIMWHEGTVKGPKLEGKKFTGNNVWLDYQKAMEKIDKDNRGDRRSGTYTKTKARFTWKDGTQRETRMDLGPNDYNPKKEYIGDYYQKTIRDGRIGEDGKWRAFDPPRYIKTRTGREFGVGTYYHAQGLKKNKDRASQDKQPSMVKIGKFKKEQRRAFQSAVDMQVEDDIKNNSRWSSFTDKDKKEMRARLVKRYNDNPKLIKDRWYMATMRVYESKDFSKYLKDEEPEKVLGSYTSRGYRPQKSKPWTSRKGPGKGWHGQRARHSMAAMKGHRNRRP